MEFKCRQCMEYGCTSIGRYRSFVCTRCMMFSPRGTFYRLPAVQPSGHPFTGYQPADLQEWSCCGTLAVGSRLSAGRVVVRVASNDTVYMDVMDDVLRSPSGHDDRPLRCGRLPAMMIVRYDVVAFRPSCSSLVAGGAAMLMSMALCDALI